MIESADEFLKLRESDVASEQYRASHDGADISVWLDIIKSHPEFKIWVIHNKTVQIEVLEMLCVDENPEVRSAIARKRKINDKIFNLLRVDSDENVRYNLICNTKLGIEQINTIRVNDSDWLKTQLDDRISTIIT